MFGNTLLCLITMLVITAPAAAAGQIWQEVEALTQSANPASSSIPGSAARQSADSSARRYQVDVDALRASLQRVSVLVGPGSLEVIRLPMPDGSLADFKIYESPIMADELARKYPEIRTFQVYGIDDPTASGRLDITPSGFHALLNTSRGRLFIDPDSVLQQSDRYLARSRSSSPSPAYACRIDDLDMPAHAATDNASAARVAARIPNKFLRYRIAVAATHEYVDSVYNKIQAGDRKAQAQDAIVTAINRVNQIYQRDLGIFLELVGGNDELIELGNEAGFSNSSPVDLIYQNQDWIDSKLDSWEYDIGHVFSTGGGGVAWLGSTCDDANKARGTSGIGNPVGDPFYIDFVAHEIGHQFNAEHSFNGTEGSCDSGRYAPTAYEPGSGSTIMAYAGICGVEDLQTNSDATFHAGSIIEINNFTGRGGSCYGTIDAFPANPNEPVVNGLSDKIIPVNTPFVLDASANDADMDALTYQWDQMDTGCSTNATSFGTDWGDNPLFRSYVPQTTSERHFPALGTQVQGLYDDAEVLPCQARDMLFQVTVRDNSSGQDTASIMVSAQETVGRFRITNMNTPGFTVDNPNPITLEWDVAGTDRAPFNCPNVDIELMTFSAGHASYSIHPLLLSTANDGIETLPITPATDSHPRARIRVKCSDNIFYDISDADFAIIGTGATSFGDSDTLTFFNNNGTTGTFAPVCNIAADCTSTKPTDDSGGGGGGGGALDYRWLLLLGGLLMLTLLRRRFANLNDPVRADLPPAR